MGYGVKVKVWGDYACFSRPEMKVERVSYDCITPSAAKGLLEAIYWKPAISWVVDKIHIIHPIAFTNIRRNEVQEVATLAGVKKVMRHPTATSYEIITTEVRHQRAAMVLKNVLYVIEAHFEMNPQRAGVSDTPEKHYNIALRRLRQGQYFQKPFLGTREFSANYELLEPEDPIPVSQILGEQDFGYMLHSLQYAVTSFGKENKQTVSPVFFRAIAVNGVIDLTKNEEVFS